MDAHDRGRVHLQDEYGRVDVHDHENVDRLNVHSRKDVHVPRDHHMLVYDGHVHDRHGGHGMDLVLVQVHSTALHRDKCHEGDDFLPA